MLWAQGNTPPTQTGPPKLSDSAHTHTDSHHPVALLGQDIDIVRYSYPSIEIGYNTSPFRGLHIARQNENGIRYNSGHCRLDRLGTAKNVFIPTYWGVLPNWLSLFSKNLSGCVLIVCHHRVQFPLLIASCRGDARWLIKPLNFRITRYGTKPQNRTSLHCGGCPERQQSQSTAHDTL